MSLETIGGPTHRELIAEAIPAAPELHFEPGLLDELVMRLRYTPALLPEPSVLAAFDARIDRIYRTTAGPDRRGALDRETGRLVAHLGLAGRVRSVLAEYGSVQDRLARVILARATAGDQCVDVHGPDTGGRLSLVVRLELEVWLDVEACERMLRHELEHARDMMDPAFAYDPAAPWPGATHGQRRRARQRFTALWCCTVDSRLARAGRSTPATRGVYEEQLERLLDDASDLDRAALCAELCADRPWTHRELLERAARMYRTGQDGRGSAGAPCPLCGFPSCEWADPAALSGAPCDAIQVDFPRWRVEDGCCLRCRECYESRPTASHGRVR